MNLRLRTLLSSVLILAVLSGPAWAKEKTLYKRLGGKKAITAVVDEFVGRVAGDSRRALCDEGLNCDSLEDRTVSR